jgi:hypothetical protein
MQFITINNVLVIAKMPTCNIEDQNFFIILIKKNAARLQYDVVGKNPDMCLVNC